MSNPALESLRASALGLTLGHLQSESDSPRGNVFVVFGPPGGVGKTTLAVNLALAFAQEEGTARVGLIDFDFRLNDVGPALGLPVERNFAALAAGQVRLTVYAVKQYLYHHSSGLDVLPSFDQPSQRRNLDTAHVERVLSLLRRAYSHLVVDTAGNLNEAVNHALQLARQVLVVQPTDLRTLRDGELAIERLRSCNVPQENIKVVLNSVRSVSYFDAASVERGLGFPVLDSIPYDPLVIESTQAGAPIVLSYPDSDVARTLKLLARSLL